MKLKKYGPFTLFLCFALIVFILFSPYFLDKPHLGKLYDKVFKKNIEWRGIITIWDYPRLDITTGYNYSWLRDKIEEFERKNPGVIIEFETLDPQFGHIKLETALRTNTLPDIAPIGSKYEYVSRNLLEPLDEYITEGERNDYKIQAISAVKHNNKLWGLPYMIEPYTLLLNKEIFEKREVPIPKDGNWSYEEFVKALQQLTYSERGNKKNNHFGFNSFIQPNYYNTWGVIMSDEAEIIDKETNKYKFYGENAASGLKKLVDLKQLYGVTPKDFGTNSESQAWKSFALDQKVAVYPAKSSKVNQLKILKSNGKGFDFDVANYPIGGYGMPVSFGDSVEAYGIFKQEDKKKLEVCVEFIKYLTDDSSQEELYKQGVFPVKKSVGDIYEKDKIMKKIEKSLSYSQSIPKHPKWLQIDGMLQSQIRMILAGEKTIEEALLDAKNRIEQIETH